LGARTRSRPRECSSPAARNRGARAFAASEQPLIQKSWDSLAVLASPPGSRISPDPRRPRSRSQLRPRTGRKRSRSVWTSDPQQLLHRASQAGSGAWMRPFGGPSASLHAGTSTVTTGGMPFALSVPLGLVEDPRRLRRRAPPSAPCPATPRPRTRRPRRRRQRCPSSSRR